MKPLYKSDRKSCAEYTDQGGEICKYGHMYNLFVDWQEFIVMYN